MWLGPQTLPFCPHLADSHMGQGVGRREHSRSPPHPPALYSLHSGSTDQTPTTQSSSIEPGSSPSFSFRLVPSCVQDALGDSKLSKTLSPSLRSTPGQCLDYSQRLQHLSLRGPPAPHCLRKQSFFQMEQSHHHPSRGGFQVALASNT